jgi:hypothetical protein
MRALPLLLAALLMTLISTQVAAAVNRCPASEAREPSSGITTCRIVTGYGTAIGRGKNLAAAREAARLTCGTALIDQYMAQRREIPEDVKDDLVLACVNLDCQ